MRCGGGLAEFGAGDSFFVGKGIGMSTCEYIFSILMGLWCETIGGLGGCRLGCCLCFDVEGLKEGSVRGGFALLNGQSFEG